MNETTRYARRYHWLSETMPSFVSEPHAAVACDTKSDTLNLVAGETDAHRDALTRLSRETPERVLREIRVALVDEPMPLFEAVRPRALRAAPALVMPSRHSLSVSDLNPASVKKVLLATYEKQATSFEGLLGATGVGPMALRSLSLIAELIYNAPASRRDPAAYSFAHGGKDGHPYFVNRPVYDASVERLREAINRAKVGHSDKVESLRALAKFTSRLAKA